MKTLKIFCIFLLVAPASVFAGDYNEFTGLTGKDELNKKLGVDNFVDNFSESDKAAAEAISDALNDSINRLLEICPTHDEMIQIKKDFIIYYDKEVFDAYPAAETCTDYGDESDIMLSTYNVFRAFKFIKFKNPMPPINQTNLYDWLKSLNINIHIFYGDDISTGGGNSISLNSKGFSKKTNRKWYDADTALGLMHLAALILHEARHTDAGGSYGHQICGGKQEDESLTYGGAWAMNYYFFDWISKDNSGQFNQEIKEAAAINANEVLNKRFCEDIDKIGKISNQDSATDNITGSTDKLDEINEILEFDDAVDKMVESNEAIENILNDSINRLLEICPTDDEIKQIKKDFMIYYDKEVFDAYPTAETCTDYGDESDIMLSTYNVFRVFKLIKFKNPMPPINQTNLYDWLKSLNINIHIFYGDGNSTGDSNSINLNSKVFSWETNRKWYVYDAGFGNSGLMYLAALILHEARHTAPGGGYGHTICGGIQEDKSLAYGGAWAMNYYFFDWISKDNSGQFNQEVKEAAAIDANDVLNMCFCEEKSAYTNP